MPTRLAPALDNVPADAIDLPADFFYRTIDAIQSTDYSQDV